MLRRYHAPLSKTFVSMSLTDAKLMTLTLTLMSPVVLFMCSSRQVSLEGVTKKAQGVIWGKSASILKENGSWEVLHAIAEFVELHSTIASSEIDPR